MTRQLRGCLPHGTGGSGSGSHCMSAPTFTTKRLSCGRIQEPSRSFCGRGRTRGRVLWSMSGVDREVWTGRSDRGPSCPGLSTVGRSDLGLKGWSLGPSGTETASSTVPSVNLDEGPGVSAEAVGSRGWEKDGTVRSGSGSGGPGVLGIWGVSGEGRDEGRPSEVCGRTLRDWSCGSGLSWSPGCRRVCGPYLDEREPERARETGGLQSSLQSWVLRDWSDTGARRGDPEQGQRHPNK